MSKEYALSRVKDALDAADGNTAKATRMVMHWLEKDQSLMVGLVAPHLKSIVTHAVSYVDRHGGEKAAEKSKADEVLSDPVPEGDATGTSILENLLGLGSGTAPGHQFGELDDAPTKPGKASAAHIDAIHKIAGNKSKEDDS